MRRVSIILAILAMSLPLGWAYLSIATYYQRTNAHGVYGCGLQSLAIVIRACFASSILSGLAVFIGTVAYRELSLPRPWSRRFELAGLSLPLIISVTYAAVLLFGQALPNGMSP